MRLDFTTHTTLHPSNCALKLVLIYRPHPVQDGVVDDQSTTVDVHSHLIKAVGVRVAGCLVTLWGRFVPVASPPDLCQGSKKVRVPGFAESKV